MKTIRFWVGNYASPGQEGVSRYRYVPLHGFEKEGLIPFAGSIEDPRMPGRAADLIAKLIDDKKKRESISVKMQNRVDGKGAERIAEALLSITKS